MFWQDNVKWFYDVLNFPLFELEGHPLSLGKLIFGLALMVTGLVFSKRVSRQVDDRLYSRLSMEPSLRYTFRRLTYYFFLFLSVLFTLRVLHVPLTVFTVIGGALAVGIGFGSQNLVNNFISGVLVMVERPIRVGDYIEVDGISGRVQSIGIRSTLVRTLSNALVVLPNTTLIEKNLTNWTLSDSFSASVRFGIAYGSDVARVRELVMAVFEDLPGISRTTPPSLGFIDFGDNALIFDLSYQVESNSYPVRKGIESEIRYRLNDLFTRHQIEIPYPQRDLRLRVEDAVPVRMQS